MLYFFIIGARAGWKWLATLPLFALGLILLGSETPGTYTGILIIAWIPSIMPKNVLELACSGNYAHNYGASYNCRR